MDLSALRRKQAEVTIEFDGEFLRYTYNPHAYDDECQRVISALADQPDNSGLANIFAKLITSWDMKDGNTDIPCTYEAFHQHCMPFLRTKLINSIVEDEMERGKLRASDNGSNQQRRSALVPIGTSNSSTQNGQE